MKKITLEQACIDFIKAIEKHDVPSEESQKVLTESDARLERRRIQQYRGYLLFVKTKRDGEQARKFFKVTEGSGRIYSWNANDMAMYDAAYKALEKDDVQFSERMLAGIKNSTLKRSLESDIDKYYIAYDREHPMTEERTSGAIPYDEQPMPFDEPVEVVAEVIEPANELAKPCKNVAALEWCAAKHDGVNVKSKVEKGGCVWVDGNTKPYKDELKALGFKWSNKKKAWWYKPATV